MVDAGRRFFPMDTLIDLMTTMSANKLNVLHLHASDFCRFGVESKLYPNLTASLTGVKGGFYTQQDIKKLCVRRLVCSSVAKLLLPTLTPMPSCCLCRISVGGEMGIRIGTDNTILVSACCWYPSRAHPYTPFDVPLHCCNCVNRWMRCRIKPYLPLLRIKPEHISSGI
jgi:hypothetical protein